MTAPENKNRSVNIKDVQIGDVISIKSLEQYNEDGDEITELVEKFASKFLKVTAVDRVENEFGEITITAVFPPTQETCTFTEHEISQVLRV